MKIDEMNKRALLIQSFVNHNKACIYENLSDIKSAISRVDSYDTHDLVTELGERFDQIQIHENRLELLQKYILDDPKQQPVPAAPPPAMVRPPMPAPAPPAPLRQEDLTNRSATVRNSLKKAETKGRSKAPRKPKSIGKKENEQ